VKRVKHLLDERTERSKDGEEPLLMMSQIHGLVVRSEFHSKAEVAQNSEGNKIVKKNDLVFNKLKAHLGVFFKSNIDFDGIVSPDYAVYYSKGIIENLKFLEILFRNPEYIKEFICRATGIVEGLIRLYTSDLFDIHVAVPPISEQNEILNYIETASQKIETAIGLKQQEITMLKEYKSSLINGVVTGKVKVC
jgi:type I restriction enzyme S subunit